MRKEKLYRYIGYNGILTTAILLPDIKHLKVYQLHADGGKHLTNGERKCYSIVVPEEDVELWYEVEGVIE